MRYLPHSPTDRKEMLDAIGVSSIDDLFAEIPAAVRVENGFGLPNHATELEVDRFFRKQSDKNLAASAAAFFVGGGAYRHHVPATVDHLIQRSEFLTAYTPYQPEISQGTLQTLFEFQTQVAQLYDMEVANASMYDGSTGTGEAVLMAHRATKRKKAIISGGVHPQYIEVIENLSDFGEKSVLKMPANVEVLGHAEIAQIIELLDNETSCVVVQTPNFFGELADFTALADAVHAVKALLIVVVTEVVSLGAVKAPGTMGADIVVGEGQSIGVGLNFGGPYVGLFATTKKLLRQMPGRVCGETVDADGKRGFVLTMSTREQHIRREKATSNICTNAGLCTLAFTIHMTLLGEKGLRKMAMASHNGAVILAERLSKITDVDLLTTSFFNEFTIRLNGHNANDIVNALAAQNILAGLPVSRLLPHNQSDDLLVIAVTETNSDEDFDLLETALREALS
ncbi:MAG: aminomethyl-transferring glycine dehydrogenase subunit GcvPA [Rhizobiales bacterium]|nr:aminomethyl-transferring glycine dehydrogenase subunit GcvPA [Hyphomicrobiales bacterium]NRB13512.1 aminomethyl-transferring glycine dehydrogenase subunit GcvPA [Hyphomicrobiales bacterium]